MASPEQHREFPTVTRFRNSLACAPCRSRHVKCDAGKPGCVRCVLDGKTCEYLKSRRGLRNKSVSLDGTGSRKTTPESTLNVFTSSTDPQSSTPSTGGGTALSITTTPCALSSPNVKHFGSSRNIDTNPETSQMPSVVNCVPVLQSDSDVNLGFYYSFFHGAHPWVVPRRRLNTLMHTHEKQLQNVLAVMQFIGSTFSPHGQSQYLRQKAVNMMLRSNLRKDGFTVQALLLLSVGIHCESNFQQSRATLDRAISIALEIGMESRGFATANGLGDAVLEESWRRTWWGLFVVDGCFEAIYRSHTFRTYHVQADVDLPCEEFDYANENIPIPHRVEEYNQRDFAEIEVTFSSFAYLIDIQKILGSVMATSGCSAGDMPENILDDVDGKLMSWKLHLPEHKSDVLRSNGDIDEPLFQAHMNFNVVQVFLHRPRSSLLRSPVETLAKCAPPSPPETIPPAKQHIYWLSTRKASSAAEAALRIFTLPTPLVKHSPLVICGVALCILAQLSACSWVLHGAEFDAARSRISLGIGTLREYGRMWTVGRQTLQEIKTIAREVFSQADDRKKAEQQALDGLQLEVWNEMQQQEPVGAYLGDTEEFDYMAMMDVGNAPT